MRRFFLLATVIASFSFLFSFTSCTNASSSDGTFETFSETYDYADDGVSFITSITSSDPSVVEITHASGSTEVTYTFKSAGTSIIKLDSDKDSVDFKEKWTVKSNKSVIKVIAF